METRHNFAIFRQFQILLINLLDSSFMRFMRMPLFSFEFVCARTRSLAGRDIAPLQDCTGMYILPPCRLLSRCESSPTAGVDSRYTGVHSFRGVHGIFQCVLGNYIFCTWYIIYVKPAGKRLSFAWSRFELEGLQDARSGVSEVPSSAS